MPKDDRQHNNGCILSMWLNCPQHCSKTRQDILKPEVTMAGSLKQRVTRQQVSKAICIHIHQLRDHQKTLVNIHRHPQASKHLHESPARKRMPLSPAWPRLFRLTPTRIHCTKTAWEKNTHKGMNKKKLKKYKEVQQM